MQGTDTKEKREEREEVVMSLEISTAGLKVKYCIETTAGTRPTTGYTEIPDITSIPEYNPQPNNLQTTPLSATKFHTYIPGLQDPGGAMGLSANDTTALHTAWDAMVTAAATARASGKALWIEYAIPGRDSMYYTAIPTELGFGGAEVDAVLTTTCYLTPNSEPVWAAAST